MDQRPQLICAPGYIARTIVAQCVFPRSYQLAHWLVPTWVSSLPSSATGWENRCAAVFCTRYQVSGTVSYWLLWSLYYISGTRLLWQAQEAGALVTGHSKLWRSYIINSSYLQTSSWCCLGHCRYCCCPCDNRIRIPKRLHLHDIPAWTYDMIFIHSGVCRRQYTALRTVVFSFSNHHAYRTDSSPQLWISQQVGQHRDPSQKRSPTHLGTNESSVRKGRGRHEGKDKRDILILILHNFWRLKRARGQRPRNKWAKQNEKMRPFMMLVNTIYCCRNKYLYI